MKEKIVIALGGNALGSTPAEQLILVKKTARHIVDLVELGKKVVVAHGNGPQVGMINLSFDKTSKDNTTPIIPFAECGAMSQGYIGYHLQQAIQTELRKRNMNRSCATLVTQVLVDKNDPSFKNPTKPIGGYYTKAQADKIMEETGYVFKEDAGRGYRRVVASPKPLKIIELNIIKKLLDTRHVVVCCGGGGVPVIEKAKHLYGVDAVIDKDMTSSLLARELKANKLLILTAVNEVYINFNTPLKKKVKHMDVKEAKEYIAQEQFAKGSMLPKIEACVLFAKANKKNKAIIASLNQADKAIKGAKGTSITKE